MKAGDPILVNVMGEGKWRRGTFISQRRILRSKGALTMDELAIAYLIFTFPFGWLLQIARIMLLFGDGDPFSPPESMIYLLFNVFIWYEILKGVM